MIQMIRIDERLIHGQVAVLWSKELGVDRIVVVNDKAAADPILVSTLKMAAPSAVKVIILSHEKANVLLNDPRLADAKVLVVVNSPQDAQKLVERVTGIQKVNIGNYGKANIESDTRKQLNDNVFLDESDRDALKKIISVGIPTEYQLIPAQAAQNLRTVL